MKTLCYPLIYCYLCRVERNRAHPCQIAHYKVLYHPGRDKVVNESSDGGSVLDELDIKVSPNHCFSIRSWNGDAYQSPCMLTDPNCNALGSIVLQLASGASFDLSVCLGSSCIETCKDNHFN